MSRLPALIIIFCFLVLTSSSLYAADYYVDAAQADDTRNGRSWAQAKKFINSGVSLMSGGDTLYIRDGIYQGSANRIYNVPSGSAGNYTKIYAENDWGVTISNPTDFPAYLDNSSYIEVRGVKFKDYASLKVYVNSSNHIKITRCSSDDNGGTSAGFLASNSSYVLFEECYKYGASRYAFQVAAGSGSSSYIIFRRCVVRWDYSDTIEPQACFANYDQDYVYFQNCIAIDGLDIRSQENVNQGLKGFFTPNGANQTHFQGCIALNLEGAGYWIEDAPVTNVTLTNSVAWDCKDHANTASDGYPPRTFYSRGGVGPLTLNHCVFGQSNWTSRVVDSDLGTGDTLKNSIIANFSAMTDYAEDGFDTSIYNDYYGNNGGRNRNTGLGANSLTTNPFTNSLKYLTRIESGSDLSGQADDSGDIGATILKKIGVSGALYGEAGWDTITADNLWPFPNEDIFRADMKAWSKTAGSAYAGSPAMSGDRGFCADGTTLTRYIWEYLGNAIPVELYNAPVLAAIGNQSVDENVNLDFTISATDVNGDPLTYSVSGLPAGASFNTSSRRFSWTPTYSQAGSYTITFSVNDGTGAGGTDSETIIITVNNVNRPPVIAAIGNKSVNGNSLLSFTLSVADADSDTLSYSATGLPSGATLNSSTGAFSWTPTNSQEGRYDVTFNVSDGNGGTDSEAITITVTNTNHSPVIAGPGNKKVNANSTLSFTLKVNDADGDTISYSAAGLPSGATLNASTGAFSWTPTDDQIGSYSVTFNVDDGNSGTDSRSRTITVRAGKIKYQAGWPKSTGGSVSSASLSDLDGDGDLEVVACYRTETKTYICAWHHDGTTVSGWSAKELSGVMSFAPGIADMDKDKLPEIIMGDADGKVYVWRRDGSLMADIGGSATLWPVQLYDSILSAPVTGDVDADGDMEIIVSTGDLSASGTAYLYVLDKSGNIERRLSVTNKIRSTPALGDIDGDGDLEIVVGCDDSMVYAWHHNGTAVSGFPVTTGNKVSSSPALGDIDNNGDIEIVVGSEDGGVYVWNHDGSSMTGWPKMTGSMITSSPALGDLDGDGDLEIAVGSENGYLYVWDYLGNLVFSAYTDEAIKFSSPAIGDIDGDGDREIVIGSDSDGVYAWHHNGVLVDGFALETSDDVQSSPTLADLDKDGDIELIVGSNDQRLHIWDLPGKFNSRNIDWGMFHMNPRYGGFYQKKTKLTSVKITPVERRYVGSAGGTLFVEDATSNIFGLELTIPANAISAGTNIEIAEAESAPAFSASITAVGTPVDFTSMNFSVPVMIKIPYAQSMLDEAGLTTAGNLKIYTYSESALTWSEPSGGSTVDTVNRVVWIMVDHFSLFGLGAAAAAGAGGSSAGGGGCFIATAAFGASPVVETETLIDFRDKYLMTNKPGRGLVKLYYRLSPPIAAYIEKREWARENVRGILRPIVWIAKKTLEKQP